MGWATLDWPPKSGRIKPKPKPKTHKRLLKPAVIIISILLISVIMLLAVTWKYSEATWPYPARLVQEPLVKQCHKLQQTIYELLPDNIKNTQASEKLPVNVINKKPLNNVRVAKSSDENNSEKISDTRENTKQKQASEELKTEKKITNGQQVSRSGEDLRYKQRMDMLATAYTHTGNPTASGKWPEPGVAAVDPNVIPLGTRLYVENYGYATALDTGSNIKGNRLDLFMDTKKEALKWGVREIKVYILK